MTRFVLVHGSWSDSAAWDPVAARLRSAGHQASAPDLPAHGGDSTPASQASLDGNAVATGKAAAALSGPVVLVGHSMAGKVISTVADQDPALAEPWRIEDELRKLGTYYIQAGPWKGFAVRDGRAPVRSGRPVRRMRGPGTDLQQSC